MAINVRFLPIRCAAKRGQFYLKWQGMRHRTPKPNDCPAVSDCLSEKPAFGVWPSSATAMSNEQSLPVSPTPFAVSRCCARGRAHSVRICSHAKVCFQTDSKVEVHAEDGADGGGRTHTLVRVPDFESSASANSATSATEHTIFLTRTEVNHFSRHRLFTQG